MLITQGTKDCIQKNSQDHLDMSFETFKDQNSTESVKDVVSELNTN